MQSPAMTQDHSDDLAGRLGRRVRELRLARGWTQEELGSRAKVKPETVSRIETSTVLPDLRTLSRIAPVLGARLGDLLDAPSSELDVLTAEERNLLAAWRCLPIDRRGLGLGVLLAMTPDEGPRPPERLEER